MLLAAGESRRMNREKALLPWPPSSSPIPGETFLSASIRALSPFNDMVLVVTGKNGADLSPVIYSCGAFLVSNPHPERGQFSSLQVGLQEVLNRGRDAAMITLVDRPPVRDATLETLTGAFREALTRRKWALVPQFGGRNGHPIVVGREMITAFLRASASDTAREVEGRFAEHIEYLEIEDRALVANINTPEDYQALLSLPLSETPLP